MPNFCETIDHVAVAVENLDEGIRWYRDCLGYSEVDRRRTEGDRTSMLSAVMVSGKSVVVLIQGTSPESQVSRFIKEFGPGVQHLAFSLPDLDEALKQVKSGGGDQEVEIIEGEGIRQVFLRRDPASGVRVELIERKGGTFNDKSVQRLFREFESKGLY